MTRQPTPRPPRRRQASTIAPISAAPSAPPADNAGGAELLDESPDELSELLASFASGGYKAQLERKNSRGRPEYLGTLDLTAELLDDVRALHGGGEYRARVVDQRSKYQASLQFNIAGAPRDPDAAMAPPRDAAPDRLERLESIVERLVAAHTAPPAPAAAPDMLGLFSTFAKLMRDLTPAAAPIVPAAAPVDPFALVGRVLEVQELLRERDGGSGRGGSDGDSLSSVVRSALPPLLDTIKEKMQTDRDIARMRARQRIALVPDAAPPAPAPADASPLAVLVKDLPRFAVEYLANMAALDKDPALYASTVLDRLPAEVVDRLPEVLGGENAGAELVALVPAWAPYAEWFQELAREMLVQYAAMQDDGEPAGDAGATADSA